MKAKFKHGPSEKNQPAVRRTGPRPPRLASSANKAHSFWWLALSVFICVYLWFQTPVCAAQTLTGIDVLEAQDFAPLAGKRVGLITNQTGIDRNGRSTIDLLSHARSVKLVGLFSPEHGIRGTFDERVSSTRDEATGLPVYSLYGDTDRPTDTMLAGLDVLVFDIQDAGVRFYTYITTMGYAM